MEKATILIIDDERLLVKSACMALELHGFRALGAMGGEEGLAEAEKARPDLILLDIMMPGMDGWEVLKRLKEKETTQDIPVVIFTAKEYSDGKTFAVGKGAADYIAKPFELDELVLVIQTHLRRGSK